MHHFMKRPAAVLTSVLLLATTIAGCGSATKEPPPGGSQIVDGVDKSKLAKELHLFNWTEYMPESILKEFENRYGVEVKYDTYSSNEEMHAKLKAGASGYDIVFPSDYMMTVLQRSDLVQKLDMANIPNFKNIDAQFKGLPHDKNNEYTVPYLWGTSGIIFDSTKVDPATMKGYKDLWRPEFKGKLVMQDDARETIGAALKAMGGSMNEKDPAVLEKAKAKVLELKPNVKVFNSDSPKDLLLGGEVIAGVVWAGEAAHVLREDSKFKYILPEEGVTIWVDNMAIPKGSTRKYTAEVFINFILEPEISKQLSEAFPYGNPNAEANKILPQEFRDNPAINPPAEGLKKGQYIQDMGDEINQIYDQIWTELKG